MNSWWLSAELELLIAYNKYQIADSSQKCMPGAAFAGGDGEEIDDADVAPSEPVEFCEGVFDATLLAAAEMRELRTLPEGVIHMCKPCFFAARLARETPGLASGGFCFNSSMAPRRSSMRSSEIFSFYHGL